jgi:uncharacterized membrane protein
MKYEYFLKWWLIFGLVTVGLIFSFIYGIPQNIWAKDASYLSATTLIIYLVFSTICGCKIFSAYRADGADSLRRLRNAEEVGWFVSEMCLNLGMLGTIIGFVLMLVGFETLDISNQNSVQSLLSELGKSMATALYTTMVGLMCGQLLKMQYFLLAKTLDDKEFDGKA